MLISRFSSISVEFVLQIKVIDQKVLKTLSEELEAEAKKTYKKTQLDDQFFSLREMEEVCQKQEEKEVDEAILDEDIMDELYGDGIEGT